MRLCSHCGLHIPNTSGLCMTCYQYKRRNDKPRPAELIQRDLKRKGC